MLVINCNTACSIIEHLVKTGLKIDICKPFKVSKMLEKSFGLLFYLKKPSGSVLTHVPIYLRITVNGETKELSVKRTCEISRWNSKLGKAIGTSEEAKSLNKYLELMQFKVNEARRVLIDDRKEVTALAIKNVLTGISDCRMILEIFQDHNLQMKSLVGKEYAEGTLDLFERTLLHTQRFIQWKYNANDLDIHKLDYEFISQFSFYLRSIRNCQHNTSIKYLTYFRKIVLLCVKSGWLVRDPFALFKLTKKEKDRDFLTETELDTITSKKFVSGRLVQVRDIFLFSCYTGLAYADVKNLQSTDIKYNIDGEIWVSICRQKTDTPSKIPLLPPAIRLIKFYQEHPQCVNKGIVLPVLSNQKMNAYLKEIADVCGISKDLTFHIARHTFATTITLNNGVPMETVSKMLGHRNLKQTQHYAKLLDKKVSHDMSALKAKFV